MSTQRFVLTGLLILASWRQAHAASVEQLTALASVPNSMQLTRHPTTQAGPVDFMCLASTVKSAPWLSMKTAISSWVAASRKPGVSAPTISRDGMATPGPP